MALIGIGLLTIFGFMLVYLRKHGFDFVAALFALSTLSLGADFCIAAWKAKYPSAAVLAVLAGMNI